MAKYLLRRFLQLVVVSFIISVLVFLLVHLLPGDPTTQILGANDTAANRAILLKQLGLNLPLWHQYTIWLNAAFHGNLGTSYLNHESVTHILATGAPVSIELIIISQVLAFAVAIPLALVASRKPNKPVDNISTTATFGLLALPPFVVAPILVAVFAVGLGWFPATGYTPINQNFAQNIHQMILPSIAITAGSIAVYFRLLRSDLITTLQQDFITMARSKGLSNRRIMWRHAFRPSSFSLLAAAGIHRQPDRRHVRGRGPVRHAGDRVRPGPGSGAAGLPGRPGHLARGGHRLRDPAVHHRLHLHHRRPESGPGVIHA